MSSEREPLDSLLRRLGLRWRVVPGRAEVEEVVKLRARLESAGKIAKVAVDAALRADAAIWGKLSNRSTAPADDWPARVELLGYYLHAADRLAFQAGGAPVRESLLRDATSIAAQILVRGSWLPPDGSPPDGQFLTNMEAETIRNLEMANEEYSRCRKLIDPNLSPEAASSQLVLTLTNNGREDAPLGDYLLASAAIIKGWADSNLTETTVKEARHWKGRM